MLCSLQGHINHTLIVHTFQYGIQAAYFALEILIHHHAPQSRRLHEASSLQVLSEHCNDIGHCNADVTISATRLQLKNIVITLILNNTNLMKITSEKLVIEMEKFKVI